MTVHRPLVQAQPIIRRNELLEPFDAWTFLSIQYCINIFHARIASSKSSGNTSTSSDFEILKCNQYPPILIPHSPYFFDTIPHQACSAPMSCNAPLRTSGLWSPRSITLAPTPFSAKDYLFLLYLVTISFSAEHLSPT